MNENNTLKISEAIIIITITCMFSVFAGFSIAKVKYNGLTNFTEETSNMNDKAINDFIQQYNYIKNNYYDSSKIDDESMMKIALESVLEELGVDDKYSTYMDESKYDQFNLNLNGSYEGLGISIVKDDESGKIYVLDVMKNSPAEEKLRVGDVIISIDDKLSKDITTEEFSKYVVKGDKKKFTLVIERDSKKETIVLEKKHILVC